MKFGVFFLSQAPAGVDPADALEQELGQIEYAEELGFDSVWLAEHHFTDYCVVNDPLTYAAHVAARTSRVRIGLAVSVLPLHHAIELAERCALVDILSGGRLDIGFGRGYSLGEFSGYGVPYDERRVRFEEGLEVVLRLWTEDHVTYEGRVWSLHDVSLYPKPAQRSHPPVYIASSGSPDTVALAAGRGFPTLQGVDFITPELVAERAQLYRDVAREQGRPPRETESALARSVIAQKVYVAGTAKEALSFPEPYAMWRHRKVGELLPARPSPTLPAKVRRTLRPLKRLTGADAGRDWNQMTWQDLQTFDLYGTPEECIERLERFAQAGVQHVLCWFAYGGMPDAHVRKAMRLFAREVMPAFRGAPAPRREEALVP